MKCSLGISNFLEEIISLSHTIVFLDFFALITEEGFFSLPALLWNSAFKWVYLSFSPLFFASLLFTAICKASLLRQPFCFFSFLFLGDGLVSFLLYNVTNGTPLQYSCLESSMDGGAWWAAVHGVAKSQI